MGIPKPSQCPATPVLWDVQPGHRVTTPGIPQRHCQGACAHSGLGRRWWWWQWQEKMEEGWGSWDSVGTMRQGVSRCLSHRGQLGEGQRRGCHGAGTSLMFVDCGCRCIFGWKSSHGELAGSAGVTSSIHGSSCRMLRQLNSPWGRL